MVWTAENRGRYDRRGQRYPSDLTNEEWAALQPLLPVRQGRGRPRAHRLREVMNGIRYVVRYGIPWDAMPKDLPPSSICHDYWRLLSDGGHMEQINHRLMPVMRVDDRGAGGDMVLVADVPLRHVDQVEIAEAARRVGHAGEAEVGAIGEDRCQERGDIGSRIAGPRMGEPVGEAGPAVDVAQDLGDPRARQHAVQSQGQVARGVGNNQRNPGDVELAVVDFDTVGIAARCPVGHEIQAFVQCRGAAGDMAGRVGLATDAGVPHGPGRQQVVLKGAVIAAPGDPDAAAFQPLAQRGEHSGFVEPPVRLAVREDQLAPLRRQERRRRPVRQSARAVAVHPLEEFDGGQDRIVRRARPEVERLEKARAEPPRDAVALGRGDEDVLLRHVGDGPDDREHVIAFLHADFAVGDGDRRPPRPPSDRNANRQTRSCEAAKASEARSYARGVFPPGERNRRTMPGRRQSASRQRQASVQAAIPQDRKRGQDDGARKAGQRSPGGWPLAASFGSGRGLRR